MQKAIRPYESSWTNTIPGNSIFSPKNEDKPSSLSWLTSSSSSSSSSQKPSSLSWLTSSSQKPSLSTKKSRNVLVTENAVVVFARRGCCMGHVAKRLLLTHGVNPLVVEIDEEDYNNADNIIVSDLGENMINKEKLPVMFIGGKLFGGLENLMAAHINGDLVPTLRQAGALWL
ncbi:monothiol glutaredoxin-s13 [Arabis alpina]|uniref:Monothiol glutaredoxin-s13 n=1 Tax=Arabis alpina TaxID=50452 RepID=A0A087HKS7_ARAAL|nr:monothiol glutaredoxin-s13 [Arabis alpina]